MHLDGARTEEQLLSDLPVRPTQCHQPHHLQLPPRQPRPLPLPGHPPAEPTLNLLAEGHQLPHRFVR